MLVGWDVDTENDFMNEDGKYPVPDAKLIRPQLKKITNCLENCGIPIWGSVDCHFEDDEELKIHDKHCMNGTEGQKKIPETLIRNHTFIRSKVREFGLYMDYSWNEIQIEIRNHNQIIFEKQQMDVFTNRNAKKFVDRMRISKVVVYGVATEYCVKEAVLGLLDLGITVYVLEDAIKGINSEHEESAIAEMSAKGAYFLETKDMIHYLEGGMK